MEMNVTIKNADLFSRIGKQVPFAAALSVTRLAGDTKRHLSETMGLYIDRPKPYSQKSTRSTTATKSDMTSKIFVMDAQAEFLKWSTYGGTESPTKAKALVLPAADSLRDQYGNLPRRFAKGLLSQKKRFFSGTVRGTAGVWERLEDKKLRLWIQWEQSANYSKWWPFHSIGSAYIAANQEEVFAKAVIKAIRTAK